ncbi:MAG: hypothetical protein AAB368_04895 [bacterium]
MRTFPHLHPRTGYAAVPRWSVMGCAGTATTARISGEKISKGPNAAAVSAGRFFDATGEEYVVMSNGAFVRLNRAGSLEDRRRREVAARPKHLRHVRFTLDPRRLGR